MEHPYASVVILSMNPPAHLYEDLRNQTFTDFEIIVANKKGIVSAMNEALEKARGEIFVRIDDDVRIPPKWLEWIVDSFKMGLPIAGVTGPTFVEKERRCFRDSIRIWEKPNLFLRWLCDFKTHIPAKIHRCGSVSYASNFEEQFPVMQYGFEPDHLEGTNWAMRTELIREVGGFDEAFDGVAEWFDTDVEMKIKKLGYHLSYNPQAWLLHNLEKGAHFTERFQGVGRIKNWLRFHARHSKYHWKMYVFLFVWILYFISLNFRRNK